MSAQRNLTPEQAAVVTAPHGALFVSAAAGVGKTTVLTARFVSLIMGDHPHPGAELTQVATITYTDKAAGEISERIRQALIARGRLSEARQIDRAWISTIHGMCARILRRHAFEAGIDPRFRVVQGAELAAVSSSAMETAIRASVDADARCEELLVRMGASALMTQVRGLYDQLRSTGASPADLIPPDPVRPAQITCLADELDDIERAMAGLGPQTPTVLDNRARLSEFSGLLRQAAMDPDGVPAALSALPKGEFLRAQGSAELKELVQSARVVAKQAEAILASTICQEMAAALTLVLQEYDRTFSAAKSRLGALDFEDLQLRTVELLERHPDIANAYKAGFQELMIDEFQDTNALQVRVSSLIATDDVVTVGDDKQSIYGFRNADVELFRTRAASAPVRMELRKNWRSHPHVLGALNALFGSSEFFEGDFMPIDAGRTGDGGAWVQGEDRLRLLVVDPQGLTGQDKKRAEAAVLARELRRLADLGVPQGDMAVLFRAARNRVEIFEDALRAEGLRVYVSRGGAYFDRPEVIDALMLLRAVDNPLDSEALIHVLASPLTGLSDDALHALALAARATPLWLAVDSITGLAPDDAALLAHGARVLRTLRSWRGHMSVSELLHKGCELLEYDITLFASGHSGPRAWANVLKLARTAEEFDRVAPGRLGAFLDFVAAKRESDDDRQATLVAEDVDAVRLMTVHAAKGLEFGVVALPDLGSDSDGHASDALIDRDGTLSLALRLPRSLAPDDRPHGSARYLQLKEIQEQRDADEAKRLFYVACTRAREALILCGSTAPEKEAKGDTMLARVRRALGMGAPDATASGPVMLGDARMQVEVVPGEAPAEQECVWPKAPPLGTLEPLDIPSAPAAEGFVPRHVSYSAMRVYDDCPYRYYATYAARLGAGASSGSTAGLSARNFGTAAHDALRLASAGRLTPERLAGISRAHGLGAEDQQRLARAVGAFAASDVAAMVREAERVQAECPIAVPVGDTLLTGSIDLVAHRGDRALVVDYKTGRGDRPEGAQEHYRDQGGCYALALLKDGAAGVDVAFVEVERSCATTSFSFGPGDAAGIEAAIASRLERMRSGEFGYLGEYSPATCVGCPALGGLCPVTPPR